MYEARYIHLLTPALTWVRHIIMTSYIISSRSRQTHTHTHFHPSGQLCVLHESAWCVAQARHVSCVDSYSASWVRVSVRVLTFCIWCIHRNMHVPCAQHARIPSPVRVRWATSLWMVISPFRFGTKISGHFHSAQLYLIIGTRVAESHCTFVFSFLFVNNNLKHLS